MPDRWHFTQLINFSAQLSSITTNDPHVIQGTQTTVLSAVEIFQPEALEISLPAQGYLIKTFSHQPINKNIDLGV